MKEERKRAKKDLRPCKMCGYGFSKAFALCPSCGTWNTFGGSNGNDDQTILLSDIPDVPLEKIKTGPWDPCFSDEDGGHGIVTSSVTLLGGAPGAGKSTLSLQLTDQICGITQRETLFVGAEQSGKEIQKYAKRIGLKNMNLIRLHPMGSSADLGDILMKRKPCATVVDSLPGLTTDHEAAVEICKRFKQYAVELNMPVIIIDHITKDGDMAGLMALQHEVDTLILFTKIDEHMRELNTRKNRFGPERSMVLKMTEHGIIYRKEDNEED